MCTNVKLMNRLISEVSEWSARNFGAQISKWVKHALPCASDKFPLMTVPSLPNGETDPDQLVLNRPDLTYPMILGMNASLLGIVEECGELLTALRIGDKDTVRDSIGDTMIYLADYLYRCDLDATQVDWNSLQKSYDVDNVVVGTTLAESYLDGRVRNDIYMTTWDASWEPDFMSILGRLVCINLKRHQGIRGYDTDKFFVELKPILTDLYRELRLCFVSITDHPLTVPEATDAVLTLTCSVWEHVKQRDWKTNRLEGSV